MSAKLNCSRPRPEPDRPFRSGTPIAGGGVAPHRSRAPRGGLGQLGHHEGSQFRAGRVSASRLSGSFWSTPVRVPGSGSATGTAPRRHQRDTAGPSHVTACLQGCQPARRTPQVPHPDTLVAKRPARVGILDHFRSCSPPPIASRVTLVRNFQQSRRPLRPKLTSKIRLFSSKAIFS